MTRLRYTNVGLLIQIVIAATTAFGQVPVRPADGSVGSIELHTVDGFGGLIAPSAVTRLTVIDWKGEDVSPKHFDGTLQDLPYGDYSVRLFIPGFRMWARTVHVDQQKIWVTVGMQAGGIEGEVTCSLSGTLMGYKGAQAPIWIRLVQLYSDEVLESELTSGGTFSILRAPCGKYIFVVMSNNNAIRIQGVTLKLPMERLSIPIDKTLR